MTEYTEGTISDGDAKFSQTEKNLIKEALQLAQEYRTLESRDDIEDEEKNIYKSNDG